MKRLFIAAIAVTVTTVTFASSALTTSGTAVTIVEDERDKTPVKLEELPAPVKKTLASSDYDGWKPVAAYWVKTEKTSFYEIELTKGEDKKTVNLTPEGTRII
jgi:hypothetical protein